MKEENVTNQNTTDTVARYLEQAARVAGRISLEDREAALRFAAALRDPERVARLLDGIDAAALGKPRRHPVTAGHAA